MAAILGTTLIGAPVRAGNNKPETKLESNFLDREINRLSEKGLIQVTEEVTKGLKEKYPANYFFERKEGKCSPGGCGCGHYVAYYKRATNEAFSNLMALYKYQKELKKPEKEINETRRLLVHCLYLQHTFKFSDNRAKVVGRHAQNFAKEIMESDTEFGKSDKVVYGLFRMKFK